MLTPDIHNGGMVHYGSSGLNVQACFGLSGPEYLALHDDLVARGLKPRYADASIQMRFVLYCHAALDLGADVKNLILEFNRAQSGDGTDAVHALSLAKVLYHYTRAEIDIIINKTHKTERTPDAVINGVTCDLKVRIDQTDRRMDAHRHLLLAGEDDEYHERYFGEIRTLDEDLIAALRNSVQSGFEQADCVILDLSRHFHSWNHHRLTTMLEAGAITGVSDSPVPAVPGACILFSPDNANYTGGTTFNPRAMWGYLPLDAIEVTE